MSHSARLKKLEAVIPTGPDVPVSMIAIFEGETEECARAIFERELGHAVDEAGISYRANRGPRPDDWMQGVGSFYYAPGWHAFADVLFSKEPYGWQRDGLLLTFARDRMP